MIVSSPSVLEPSPQHAGRAVDQHEAVRMDRLADSRAALFETAHAALAESL